jgi:DNA-binding transcriptional ArsR family regulator
LESAFLPTDQLTLSFNPILIDNGMKRKQSDAVFRAIANPTRREILRLLRKGRHSAGEIAANFRTSRTGISKHLRLLRTAGLVVSHRDGKARMYDLDAKPLRAMNTWLRDYEALWKPGSRFFPVE